MPWGVPWGIPGGESGVGGGARMGPGPCGGDEDAAAPGGGPVGGGPVGGGPAAPRPGGGGGFARASSLALSLASCSSHCCGVMLPGIHAWLGLGWGSTPASLEGGAANRGAAGRCRGCRRCRAHSDLAVVDVGVILARGLRLLLSQPDPRECGGGHVAHEGGRIAHQGGRDAILHQTHQPARTRCLPLRRRLLGGTAVCRGLGAARRWRAQPRPHSLPRGRRVSRGGCRARAKRRRGGLCVLSRCVERSGGTHHLLKGGLGRLEWWRCGDRRRRRRGSGGGDMRCRRRRRCWRVERRSRSGSHRRQW